MDASVKAFHVANSVPDNGHWRCSGGRVEIDIANDASAEQTDSVPLSRGLNHLVDKAEAQAQIMAMPQ